MYVPFSRCCFFCIQFINHLFFKVVGKYDSPCHPEAFVLFSIAEILSISLEKYSSSHHQYPCRLTHYYYRMNSIALKTSLAGCSKRVYPTGDTHRTGPRLCTTTRTRTSLYSGNGSTGDDEVSTPAVAIAVAGLALSPIVFWSEYTLATTGSGLPPGPGGALGAAEGISYLASVGIVAWSLKTKVQTGSGLPAGPSGLVGAAEGVSYLAVLGGLIAAGVSSLN